MTRLSTKFNSVSVNQNEEFEIALGGPMSGHQWSLRVIEGEGRVLRHKPEWPKDAQMMIGGKATDVFTLVADKAGKMVVEASFKRPWESTAARTETFTITVK